jgi:hypothetical protein
MRLPAGAIPCNEQLAPVDLRDLSPVQKASFRTLEKELKRWKRLLKMDPIWEIYILVLPEEQMGEAAAATDIGESEYYRGTIFVKRESLDVEEKERFDEMRRIACHELLHASTSDYQRAALTAAANARGQKEIAYRYEQMVVRMTAALCAMDDARRKEIERRKKHEQGSGEEGG